MAAGVWAAAPGETPAHLTSVVTSDVRTGKLVHTVVVSAKVVNEHKLSPALIEPRAIPAGASAEPETPAPTGIAELIESIAAEHSLPPNLIHAVIRAESNYNPVAISPKGALGLMQLIPATARRFGVAHVFDPAENIRGGARYLKYLLDLYDNDGSLALAAYNAGEAAVAKYNGIPPFPETRNYVVQVKSNFEKLVAAERAKQAAQPVVEAAPPQPKGPAHVQQVIDPDGSVRYVSR